MSFGTQVTTGSKPENSRRDTRAPESESEPKDDVVQSLSHGDDVYRGPGDGQSSEGRMKRLSEESDLYDASDPGDSRTDRENIDTTFNNSDGITGSANIVDNDVPEVIGDSQDKIAAANITVDTTFHDADRMAGNAGATMEDDIQKVVDNTDVIMSSANIVDNDVPEVMDDSHDKITAGMDITVNKTFQNDADGVTGNAGAIMKDDIQKVDDAPEVVDDSNMILSNTKIMEGNIDSTPPQNHVNQNPTNTSTSKPDLVQSSAAGRTSTAEEEIIEVSSGTGSGHDDDLLLSFEEEELDIQGLLREAKEPDELSLKDNAQGDKVNAAGELGWEEV